MPTWPTQVLITDCVGSAPFPESGAVAVADTSCSDETTAFSGSEKSDRFS